VKVKKMGRGQWNSPIRIIMAKDRLGEKRRIFGFLSFLSIARAKKQSTPASIPKTIAKTIPYIQC